MKTKLKNQKGFTIIEVLIVLAIAGLILLIVFLAVPALQRNSRNTQMRNDTSVVLGYANDFAANNNGATPTGAYYDSGTGNICMHTAAVSVCASSAATGYMGKIRAGVTTAFTISTTGPSQPTAANNIAVWIGGKCLGNTIAGGTANGRAVSTGYVTETGTGVANQCQES